MASKAFGEIGNYDKNKRRRKRERDLARKQDKLERANKKRNRR